MSGTRRFEVGAWLGALVALAASMGLLSGAAVVGAPVPSSLVHADRLYTEKSYGAAAKAYEQLAATRKIPAARKDEVQYRIAVALGKGKQWDRALERSLAFVKGHRDSVWEPRGLYWLARLYLAVPHQAWRVDNSKPDPTNPASPTPTAAYRVFRGDRVPQQAAGGTPEQVQLAMQDLRNALDALEAARVLYPRFRKTNGTVAEEIQLNHDLVRVLGSTDAPLRWATAKKWKLPTDASWVIDPGAAYSSDWPYPKRVLFLYEQSRFLSRQLVPAEGGRAAALALLGKAMWLRDYHAMMAQYARITKNYQSVKIPYPYQSLKGEAVLRELVRSYPDLPVAEQAQFTLGNWLEGDGKYVEAEREYRRLISTRPGSSWVANARAQLQQLQLLQLNVGSTGTSPAGKPMEVQVSYRNLKRFRFDVYPLDLRRFASGTERMANPHAPINSLSDLWGSFSKLSQRSGAPVLSREVTTTDTGDHSHRSDTFPLPLTRAGAYVIQVSAPGVRSARLHLVTDLALVQKIDRDSALLYAADARSGAPARDADVWAKVGWVEGSKERSIVLHQRTNREGATTIAFPLKANRSNFHVSSAAFRNGSYALTGQGQQAYAEPLQPLKVYSLTDRAVYRPEQVVHYRQLIMRRKGGEWRPAAGERIRVQISDPRGAQLLDRTLLAGEFGSINGELTLAEDAPLGEYTIQVTVPKRGEFSEGYGANRFRVEEYKKPEFEITVEPAAERVRLGEKATARVEARYYFGGPVPNAKVTYRLYRNPFAPQHRFPRPYDFLSRYWNEGNYQTDYRQGEVVTQGEARTDAEGNAKIEFATAPSPQWVGSDVTYTVEADVQDASRRVISGSGAVKATRHDVLVYLDFPQGYARKNERVRVEVATTDPSDHPVPVSGTASIFRQNPMTGQEALLSRKPLATDEQGRAFIEWTPPAGGYYRFEYEARDRAEQVVKGLTHLWVEGPELAKTDTSGSGLMLQPEKQAYEEGQQAKVLVITPFPGCTVLLSREANNEILGRQLLYVAGRSLEVTLPLNRAEVPNVYLSAVVIRNHQAFRAQQELFVPPARQFAAVTVEADHARYEPGEKAKLRLLARDWRGKPLRTELSVSVTDAALGYIQKDYAPDIRLFFFGDRRSLSTQADVSPELSFSTLDQDTQRRKEYPARTWSLPDGMGMLPDWPGPPPGTENLRTANGATWSDMVLWDDRSVVASRYRVMNAMNGLMSLSRADPVAGNALSVDSLQRFPGASGEMNARFAYAKSELRQQAQGQRQSGGELADPAVRSTFADTAFWTPAVVTDAQGQASVEVTWPDNLTEWRATAAGSSTSAQVGSGETQVVTKKDLIIRLQAPRFFVERDEVVLSANVHNYLPDATRAEVSLELEGDAAELASTSDATQWVDLSKDGEQRVNWTVRVRHEGELRVRMTARSPKAADAAELTLPVLVHGVERQVAQSGVLRTERQAMIPIRLPEARKPGSSELVVQLNPSLATVALDALPYLADYPYGCIEQTMSRFLPSVIVAKTLKDLGYDVNDLRKRARQLEQTQDKSYPRGAAGGYTYPKGRPGAAQTLRFDRWRNPVFNDEELRKMVRSGLARITEFQHQDGGWGWWKEDASDPYMTAYVIYGLTLARDAGTAVDAGMLERGLGFLQGRFQREEDPHQLAYEARVLAMHPGRRNAIRERTLRKVYDRRDRLTAYSQGLLALALHDLGEREKAQVMLRNLESTVTIDRENGTASWEAEQSGRWWWRWWNNRVETNATLLEAYLAIRPDSELPAMLTKWLANNRRGAIWQSTRDTALAVLSLSAYLRHTKELSPDYTLTVGLEGQAARTFRVTKENALFFDGGLTVPDELLRTGEQPLRIKKTGTGPLYYSAYTRYFSLEEPIRATGNEVFVQRRYFRLRPGTAAGTADRQALLNSSGTTHRENPFLSGNYRLLDLDDAWVLPGDTNDGPRYERTPLHEGEVLTSGDLLEVELQLQSKNDYDYLIFEDMKPSGCEPVEVRSGDKGGLGLYSNMELRDEKVAFFLASLPQGRRTLTYRLRAEIPGRFHVLPTNGYAMYAPDIRTLSDEMTFGITD